jgi:glycosyltransferase involved in cell wall biosynthesis
VNVLFLTHAFPRDVDDAAGSFILRLAVALAGQGVHATVVAPHASGLPERETLHGVPVCRFRYAPERFETLAYAGTMAEQVRSSWTARLALGGLLAAAVRSGARQRKQVRAQLLHAHWWFPSGLAAAAVATLGRLPLVTTLHGSDVRLATKIGPARPLFARVAARSSVMTAVSTWLASQASALAPNVALPRVAPMPADVELFSPGTTRIPNRLLFVGRLTAQKGVDLLIRAMADLPSDVSLDVVGDGVDVGALQRLAVSVGVAPRIRWHPPVPQVGLVDFYRHATALVVPSVEEGLGLVAVEAQLCEIPVVAFDSGGLRDVVADGKTGILVRSVNAAALATGLNHLLQLPDRGAALGRTGRARAIDTFAPDAVARHYASIYQEAINHFHDRQS